MSGIDPVNVTSNELLAGLFGDKIIERV